VVSAGKSGVELLDRAHARNLHFRYQNRTRRVMPDAKPLRLRDQLSTRLRPASFAR
jgi:hypothetical protein